MQKQIPNILSVLRIIFSFILLFLKPFGGLFYAVYIFCGLSDMLDGYIARKTKSVSRFGSVLDSIGDMVFCAVMLYIFIPVITAYTFIIIWVIGIAVLRIISIATGYFKYRKITFLHTYLNKLTGFIIFCVPLLYKVIDINILFIIPCSIASISAIEELIIIVKLKEPDRDIKGFFS
ncbi:MAG: CDP-alcohol phosphatidyltransferase [Firmicutes bacterium HGW-Firmicutes-21]|nr:MAG: CDP-alcohol phosphatidyltransferase [Firmicutes bacterium HGW-Firmicutes-21]